MTMEEIEGAAARIKAHVHRTPILTSRSVSTACGCTLALKAESFQRTGSFKIRGVINKLARLKTLPKSLLALSTGNHAQAVAFAARMRGLGATVVMPETASPVKVAAARDFGANVITVPSMSEAVSTVERLMQDPDFLFIHPFDDDDMIAGAATIALEIFEECRAPHVILVPVGGGGLLAGIAVAANALSPKTRIIGIEPEVRPLVNSALRGVNPPTGGLSIADALMAPNAGQRALPYIRKYVHDVVTVSENALREATALANHRYKALLEPAAVAGIAALLGGALRLNGSVEIVAIATGGNVTSPAVDLA